jgi:CDP-glucose 4,6-dehydratase
MAMRDFKPEVVFHMAAQSLVRPSYADPARTFETNALGTMNVLEAVRQAPSVRALVLITSDKCYRNDEWVWGYRESDHLGGKDPYSASKACAEIIAHAYFASFFGEGGCTAATVRAGNVIGGGDWAVDRIVPDCARAFAAGEAVTLRHPQATRPWQHVLEPLSGYLWLGARLLREAEGLAEGAPRCHRESFNFGPPSDVNATVREVAEALAAYWPGFSVQCLSEAGSGKGESTLLKLCCDKALSYLDWKPTLSLAESIRYTAEWYREYHELADSGNPDLAGNMGRFTSRQIAAYAHTAMERGLIWTR